MKHKKHFKNIVICFIAFLSFTLSSILISSVNNVAKASSQELQVSSTYYDSDNDVFTSAPNGMITIVVSVENVATEDIIFYYHAEDRTAISEAGDYYNSKCANTNLSTQAKGTHASTEAVITKGTKSVSIFYCTKSNGLTVYTDQVTYYSTFVFALESATGATLPEQTKYECALKVDDSMKMLSLSSSSTYALWPYRYVWSKKYDTGDLNGSDTANHRRVYTGNLLYDIDDYYRSDAIKYMLNWGLADLYVKMYCDCEIGTWNMNNFYFKLYGLSYYSGPLVGSRTFDWVTDNDNGYVVAESGYSSIGDYIKFDKSWQDAYGVYCYNESRWNRWAYITLSGTFYDSTKPVIQTSYVDTSSLNEEGIIRLTLRFNEPVQIKSTKDDIYVMGFANGTTESVKFHYIGGSYTNTLYFEANVRTDDLECKDTAITTIDLDYFGGIKNVGDMGVNSSGTNNYYNNGNVGTIFNGVTDPKCDIDIRIPKITCDSSNSNTVKARHEIKVTVSKCRAGTLRYIWSEDPDFSSENPSDYKYSISLESNSSSIHEVTIVGEGSELHGEKYLYVLVQSESKRISTLKIGRQNDNTTIGGFLFDTTQPIISNLTVTNDKPKTKTFTFDISETNNVYDSPLSQIYLAYKLSEDGVINVKKIWENQSITNILKIGSNGYKLPSDICYYFQFATGGQSIASVSNGHYNNTDKDLLFSSQSAAYEYLKYVECKDFTLKYIQNTTDIDNVDLHKEAGETRTPKIGDYWIIYKKSTTSFNNALTIEDYCFYYYKSDQQSNLNTINYNDISNSLKNAISTVSNTLLSKYATTFNFDYKSGLDATGYPIVDTSQYFYQYNPQEFKTYEEKNITNISYTDNGLFMGSKGGKATYVLEYSTLGLDEDSFSNYYIGFYALDKAQVDLLKGDAIDSSISEKIDFVKYSYDTRNLFDCEISLTQDGNNIYSLDTNKNVYNLYNSNNVVSPITIKFNASKEESTSKVYIKQIKYKGNIIDITNSSDIIELLPQGVNSLNILQAKFKKSGEYIIDIELQINNGSKYYPTITYYITENYKDDTLNYLNSKETSVLNNVLYELKSLYYYKDSEGSKKTETYNRLIGQTISSGYSAFSSLAKAKEYILFMEKQDLYFCVINEQIATALNSPNIDGQYNKADGETKEAVAGQVWIRYKIKGFKPDTIYEKWEYYYYSDQATTYSLNNIKTNLENAINANVEIILQKCSIIYLIGSTNANVEISPNYVDSYGSPTLSLSQQHYDSESTRITKSGSTLLSDLVYSGDSNLYINYIHNKLLDIDVPIVTNKVLSGTGSTSMYYAYYDISKSIDSLPFKEIVEFDGKTYKEVLLKETDLKSQTKSLSSGCYYFIEYGPMGVNRYLVYIDLEAPALNALNINANNGVLYPESLNSTSNGSVYNTKSFIISSINTSLEFDTLSYVAVYSTTPSKKTATFLNVYFYDYLKDDTNQIVLDSLYDETNEYGLYYIVVSDRSGNSYSFFVNVANEDLKVEVSVSDDNTQVYIYTNRELDQLYTFKVYVNEDEVAIPEISGKYYKFDKQGVYRIVVKDIYGYVKEFSGETSVNFERPLPTGNWFIIDDNGNSSPVTETDHRYVKIVKGLGAYTYVSTSKLLKLVLNDKFDFEVTGDLVINVDYKRVETLSNTVYFEALTKCNWTLKVFYREFKDTYVTFVCSMDNEPPTIDVSYKTSAYNLEEDKGIQTYEGTSKIGSIYPISGISYEYDSFTTQHVKENETIYASIMNLNITDTSGVYDVQVLLNGKEIIYYSIETSTIPIITLTEFGDYEIITHDKFGNEATLKFTNIKKERATISLDGENIAGDLKNSYFGSNNVTVKMCEDGLAAIKITLSDLSYKVLLFTVENNCLYAANYVYSEATNENGKYYVYQLQKNKGEDQLLSKDTYQANVYKKYYLYDENNKEIKDYTIYLMYDSYNNYYIKVVGATSRIKIEARASFDSEIEPYYIQAYISTEQADIKLAYTNNDSKIDLEEGITSVNNEFYIDEAILNEYVKDIYKNDIVNVKYIKEISVAYSLVNEFNKFTIIYPSNKENTLIDAFDTKKNGFYCINVTNIYNNTKTIIINRNDTFTVETVAIYNDETTNIYSTDYSGVTKSNEKVIVRAYTSITSPFTVMFNGELKTIASVYEGGINSLILFEEGSYVVTCTDKYSNVVVKTIDIKKNSFVYDESLITGYSELALKKNEGYSKDLLSINQTKADELNIKQISIIYKDIETVIYDDLSENHISITSETLNNCIGKSGSGIYTIKFRDDYGNIVKKVVHYKEETTFEIYRKTSSSITSDVIDVNSTDIYSNYEVIFKSNASLYELKVDGESYPCPYELQIPILNGYAKFEYQITYIDEYGFNYSINVHLEKNELNINIPTTINIVEIDNVKTTRDLVSIFYEESVGTVCYCQLDSEDKQIYTSNTKLYKDGIYTFTIMDRAGNLTTERIKKDTIVNFAFTVSKDNKTLVSGEATNANEVRFSPTKKDSSYISEYYLDGVRMEYNDEVTFNTSGHYAFLVKDEIGNSKMFEFYIIKHSLESFTYNTPDTFKITKVFYDAGDGNSVSLLNSEYVIQNTSNSKINAILNGSYLVTMESTTYKYSVEFEILINNIPSKAVLKGCSEGEKTLEDVTIEGYSIGDTIYVYKDNVLIETVEVTSSTTPVPTITEGGDYEIRVVNESGVTKSLRFRHIYIPNVSGSILIIILSLGVAGGIVTGVVMRNKQKFDE